MLDFKKMQEAPLGFFATLKGVTLHSLSIEEIKAPLLNFHNKDSQIEIAASVVLDYSGLYQAEIDVIFTTLGRVNSLDKLKAIAIIKNAGFYCDVDCDDEWEYDCKLGVDVTTKDQRITESLYEYSYDTEIDYDKERDEHHARLLYTLAGEISEYFTNYMGDFRYEAYDENDADATKEAAERRILGNNITKALIEQACTTLGEPADTELELVLD